MGLGLVKGRPLFVDMETLHVGATQQQHLPGLGPQGKAIPLCNLNSRSVSGRAPRWAVRLCGSLAADAH